MKRKTRYSGRAIPQMKRGGGSGLGMYLVKEIIEGYGGSVDVKDSELGGARFDVHLKKVDE